jgi:hypothetical protein
MYHIFQPISSLPFEIRSKIFSLVGNQINSFGSVAGVCREWWKLAYGDRQQHFSRTISLFAHSPDRTSQSFLFHFFLWGGDWFLHLLPTTYCLQPQCAWLQSWQCVAIKCVIYGWTSTRWLRRTLSPSTPTIYKRSWTTRKSSSCWLWLTSLRFVCTSS